jgi:hypothetical protein
MNNMARFIFFILLTVFISNKGFTQSVAINTSSSSPDESALLDVQSTTKGVLFPRMLEAERTAIVSPATGLLVYQTDGVNGYYYNSGTTIAPVWIRLSNDKATVAFSANATIGQAFNPTAYVKVQFNTEEYDESANFVQGATSEFTAPSAGIYHFSTVVTIAGAGPGTRYDVSFFVNGIQRKNVLMFASSSGLMSIPLSSDFKLALNDKVDVRIAATSIPAVIIGVSAPWVFFSGHKIN